MALDGVLTSAPARDEEGLVERSTRVDVSDLARASREIAEAGTTEDTVAQIVIVAARMLGTPYAGVTKVRGRGQLETILPTSDLVARADQLQYGLGEGPCIDAATESRTVVSEDLDADPRWPRWGPHAAELGFLSILSAELCAGGVQIGSLNMYGTRSGQFTRGDVQMVQILASHASLTLAAVGAVTNLEHALDNRTMIGQAQGILMERFAVDGDRAFAILRRHSQDQNIKLSEVARQLVQTSALPQPGS